MSAKLLIYVLIVFLLFLSSINIENYLSPKKVLGAETKDTGEEDFWNDFMSKHPTYVPGWVELGRYEKVEEIDPNFIP